MFQWLKRWRGNKVRSDAWLAPAPCPHCGMKVIIKPSPDGILFVCPPDSPCRGSGLFNAALAGTENTAIAAWNRRANTVLSEQEH